MIKFEHFVIFDLLLLLIGNGNTVLASMTLHVQGLTENDHEVNFILF